MKQKDDDEEAADEAETDDESVHGEERTGLERRRSSRLLRIRSVAKWDEEELDEHEEELRQQLAYLQQKTNNLHG